MILTAKVKLQPTQEQFDSLVATLAKANEACNYISQVAWDTKTFGRFSLQKLVYQAVKDQFDLTAQLVIRCIAKVCDAYKKDKRIQRTFKPTGSTAFDVRILSWKLDKNEVSIWTVDGRIKALPFVCHDRAKELLSGERGESDLVLIKDEFYLFTSCEVDEPTPDDTDDVLGVDLGIATIAVDSDKTIYQGKAMKSVRFRHRRLRQKLQKKGTLSAKRRLGKLSGKETRFAKDVNHVISKRIVAKAKDTGRGIAIEELGGIRERVTVRTQRVPAQRATLHSWSFFQLRTYIEYKAKLVGVKVIPVDPRNTSRTCPCCGHIDKANRKTQDKFLCVDCGFSGLHPEGTRHIAATNIRSRAAVNPPYVSTVEPTTASETRQRPLVVGS